MKLAITFFLTIHLLFSSTFGQSVSKTLPAASTDSLMERKMIETGIVGMAASIIIDKKVVWMKGYGYADLKTKSPFSPATVMNIASISKTFTGVCIMKAVEDGIVSLDEDINVYLPFKVINPNFPNEKITLRHLATHTSGLTDRDPFYMDSTVFYGGAKPEPLGEFLKNYFVQGGKYYTKDNFLNEKPGTYRAYSNIAAGLAGYIIECKTGKKLNEYAKKNIFNPLKMANTGWTLSEIDTTKHAKLYRKKGTSLEQIQWYEGTTYPDGGIRTSVEELSTFFISLLNGGKYGNKRILKEETINEMLRFQHSETNTPKNVKPGKLNQGIFWATKLGATRMGHNGSDPGVRTFMLSDLNKEFAVILFFNTELSEEEGGIYFDFYEELYTYAKELKSKQKSLANPVKK